MSELLFKFTGPGRTPTQATNGFVWPKPSGKRPGKWAPVVDNIVPCARGYHLIAADHLLEWLGPELWVAEGRGERIDAGDKIVFSQARLVRRLDVWNDRTARLFAVWCAEQVLDLIPEPHRAVCAETLRVATAYADGEATHVALAAARDAAWDAAWDVPWYAARAAQQAHLLRMLGLGDE